MQTTNWAMFAAVASLIGVLITILSVAYTSGKLTQKISDSQDKLCAHDATLDRHEVRLGAHDIELAKITAWKDGFNAASRTGSVHAHRD